MSPGSHGGASAAQRGHATTDIVQATIRGRICNSAVFASAIVLWTTGSTSGPRVGGLDMRRTSFVLTILVFGLSAPARAARPDRVWGMRVTRGVGGRAS